MSQAKELLGASRGDAFLIGPESTAQEIAALDLRLVQGFKRSGSTFEVRFADLAKLCEIADRAEMAEREAAGMGGGQVLRELLGVCAEAAESDEDSDICAE